MEMTSISPATVVKLPFRAVSPRLNQGLICAEGCSLFDLRIVDLKHADIATGPIVISTTELFFVFFSEMAPYQLRREIAICDFGQPVLA